MVETIEYKTWKLKKKFSVKDLLLLLDEEKSPTDKIKAIVKLLESKREAGPKITISVDLLDFKNLQEKITEAFL